MGIKHQSVSDPDLAKPHEKGTSVKILQHAEHKQYGTISYEIRRLWRLHLNVAEGSYTALVRCHREILQLPIQPSGDRVVVAEMRPDLTALVYVAGSQMVMNTALTMQHLCEEISRTLNVEFKGSTIGERIKEAFEAAALPFGSSEPGYSAFREILERRDAIEHPKASNVFNSHPNEWDKVPLNWLLTERAPESFKNWHDWIIRVGSAWDMHPVRQPRTVTLTVERGVSL